jgi:hypothetical protein
MPNAHFPAVRLTPNPAVQLIATRLDDVQPRTDPLHRAETASEHPVAGELVAEPLADADVGTVRRSEAFCVLRRNPSRLMDASRAIKGGRPAMRGGPTVGAYSDNLLIQTRIVKRSNPAGAKGVLALPSE